MSVQTFARNAGLKACFSVRFVLYVNASGPEGPFQLDGTAALFSLYLFSFGGDGAGRQVRILPRD